MRITIALTLIMLLGACSIEPAEIEYGFDQCSFCQMTIVDKSHAAILVSDKGKSEKFDAIECMLRHMSRSEEKKEYAMKLVSDYSNPSFLIDAEQSVFIVSKEIPSPMGAYLSAVSNKKIAAELLDSKGGEIFDWNTISDKIR